MAEFVRLARPAPKLCSERNVIRPKQVGVKQSIANGDRITGLLYQAPNQLEYAKHTIKQAQARAADLVRLARLYQT